MSTVFDLKGFSWAFLSVKANIVLQDKVRRKERCDDILVKEIEERWTLWLAELKERRRVAYIAEFFPPRFRRLISAQVHHFSDASPKAAG